MKLIVTVVYSAAIASCFPNPMPPSTKTAAAPIYNAPTFLRARAPDPRQELYQRAVEAQTAARQPRLEPNHYYYFIACGRGDNTWAEFKDGIDLRIPRPQPKEGRPPLPETPSELRAKKDEAAWKNGQKRVKEKTGCDHVGFVVGEVAKPGVFTQKLLFKAQLYYVVPVSSPSRTERGLSVARWQN
ncbi:uncharacterized protein LY79DRAFT_692336 [Colletotrichum navitas]|uniref:Uncharacterized protein n=1 Tax=Colletotrichum navitas TaxID=681940 RepID=A0AAD8UX89_9PEZI|nr:uncharacterized protein LY79DRAFT_692336 [Colletotrichum navitas]KAK1558123.1 hypothetical protein LY79DRAFT_692336 [Colletotrichum navitas]